MKPWTIGNSTTSDVVGHVLVVHDPNTMQPLACGPIVLQLDQSGIDSGRSDAAPLSADIRAQVAGLCVDRMIVTDSSHTGCPDPERLAECACMHCELGACLEACSDYVACLEDASDGCAAACPGSDACASCNGALHDTLVLTSGILANNPSCLADAN